MRGSCLETAEPFSPLKISFVFIGTSLLGLLLKVKPEFTGQLKLSSGKTLKCTSPVIITCVFFISVGDVFIRSAPTTSSQTFIQITQLEKNNSKSERLPFGGSGKLSPNSLFDIYWQKTLCVWEKKIIITLKLFLQNEEFLLSPHLCFADIYPAVHACTTNRNKI